MVPERSAAPAPRVSSMSHPLSKVVDMESPPPPIYGFDVETDTRVDGLDPGRSRIVAAAVASATGTVVFSDADEATLLDRLDWHLAALEPGVVATWNGSAFDLPFVADRARGHGLVLGLRLALDPAIARRHAPLAGHAGAYRASWHGHAHVDGYQVFRADVAPALNVSSSLKSVARLCGLEPVQLDASVLHLAAGAAVREYVASDARCTRELISRRWSTACLAVDDPPPVPPVGAPGRRDRPLVA
jgi:DNA polymerase elongation subunit (family B)